MTTKEKKQFRSIGELLKYRAEVTPDTIAYVCLENESTRTAVTYREMYDRAARFAGFLQENGVAVGDRCILMYHQNMEVAVGIMACTLMGAVAVPVDMPAEGDSPEKWAKIIRNCGGVCVLTNDCMRSNISQMAKTHFADVPIYSEVLCQSSTPLTEVRFTDIAVLQYTSGSTSDPKGVVVTNKSLLNNLKQIEDKLGLCEESRWINWVPYHHDMGLIAGLLTAVYSGCQDIFMPPALFKQNPIIWFKVITEYKGTHTVAPNFAYELLASMLKTIVEQNNPEQIALDSLVKLISGSEPVRFNTLVKFIQNAKKLGLREGRVMTGYGLAEATLVLTVIDFEDTASWVKLRKSALSLNQVELVDGGKLDDSLSFVNDSDEEYTYLVGNGNAIRDNKVMVLNADGEEVPPLTIGEVCASGETIADGYWNNPEATMAAFVKEADGTVVLHTGDAGFFGTDGELYITGRYKDIIVIRGVNYYPADMEQISAASHSGLGYASCVFSVSEQNEDSLVIVQEVADRTMTQKDLEEAARQIRKNVYSSFHLPVEKIIFTGMNAIARTQSGKIMHKQTKQQYLSGAISDVLFVSEQQNVVSALNIDLQSKESIRAGMLQILAQHLNTAPDTIDIYKPFMQLGIHSEMSIRIIHQINEIPGVNVDIVDIFNYNTAEKFIDHIYQKHNTRTKQQPELDILEEAELADLLAAELDLQ